MDSKLLNYSKLQIPTLNGLSSHNYVIMPALLSQIDSTKQQHLDDLTVTANNESYQSIYISSENSNTNSNNLSDETVYIATNRP